ncbi:hypothetical protein GGR51DRAFT_543478 [Nemania sp. FL0031]|nr:hypothetical protein GGR51DRAFT_543478 [Nemania sp. FL0031]
MSYKNCMIVTGGTANLGYYTSLNLAKEHPDQLIIMASRSNNDNASDAINKALRQDNTIYLPLDLADTGNVRSFAKRWESGSKQPLPPIEALVLNAGLQFPGPLSTTAEGVEKTFAIAHVGHALLFHLLCPHLVTGARVVVTSSGTHDPEQYSGLPDANYTTAEELAHPPSSIVDIPGRLRYSTTKLCNVLWAYALTRKLSERAPERQISVNVIDPGLMPGTGLAREASRIEQFLWNWVFPRIISLIRRFVASNTHTPAESGWSQAKLALGGYGTGKYFEPSESGVKERKSSKASYEEGKQEDLWKWTVDFLSKGDDMEKARFESLK